MARKTFLSFHYKPDNWRVSQIKQMGKIEGQSVLSSNEWEEVKKKGDDNIKKWINDNLVGRSCQIVLIGTNTAGRKWVNYEIEQSWNKSKGVFGIHVHNLKDSSQKQSTKGSNPFSSFTVGDKKESMTKYAKVYDPPYSTSTDVYDYIKKNIDAWIEEAIRLRGTA